MAALEKNGRLLETSCGSPHYASPEIVSGLSYHGPPTDIWSCGVILFALLTGRLPFDDENIRRLLLKVQQGSYMMPDDLSLEAKDLIRRMLQIDPRRRLTSKEILQHPLVTKYYPNTIKNVRQNGNLSFLTKSLKTISDIDTDILQSLVTLWQGEDKKTIISRLLSPKPNTEKTFYCLLLNYRHSEKSSEDYVKEQRKKNQSKKKKRLRSESSKRLKMTKNASIISSSQYQLDLNRTLAEIALKGGEIPVSNYKKRRTMSKNSIPASHSYKTVSFNHRKRRQVPSQQQKTHKRNFSGASAHSDNSYPYSVADAPPVPSLPQAVHDAVIKNNHKLKDILSYSQQTSLHEYKEYFVDTKITSEKFADFIEDVFNSDTNSNTEKEKEKNQNEYSSLAPPRITNIEFKKLRERDWRAISEPSEVPARTSPIFDNFSKNESRIVSMPERPISFSGVKTYKQHTRNCTENTGSTGGTSIYTMDTTFSTDLEIHKIKRGNIIDLSGSNVIQYKGKSGSRQLNIINSYEFTPKPICNSKEKDTFETDWNRAFHSSISTSNYLLEKGDAISTTGTLESCLLPYLDPSKVFSKVKDDSIIQSLNTFYRQDSSDTQYSDNQLRTVFSYGSPPSPLTPIIPQEKFEFEIDKENIKPSNDRVFNKHKSEAYSKRMNSKQSIRVVPEKDVLPLSPDQKMIRKRRPLSTITAEFVNNNRIQSVSERVKDTNKPFDFSKKAKGTKTDIKKRTVSFNIPPAPPRRGSSFFNKLFPQRHAPAAPSSQTTHRPTIAPDKSSPIVVPIFAAQPTIQQSWISRLLNITTEAKSTKSLFSNTNPQIIREEIIFTLETWKKYGLIDLKYDPGSKTISGSIEKRNAFSLKPTVFTIDVNPSRSRMNPIPSSIIFSRSKGSKKSFSRFVSEIEHILAKKNLLV